MSETSHWNGVHVRLVARKDEQSLLLARCELGNRSKPTVLLQTDVDTLMVQPHKHTVAESAESQRMATHLFTTAPNARKNGVESILATSATAVAYAEARNCFSSCCSFSWRCLGVSPLRSIVASRSCARARI